MHILLVEDDIRLARSYQRQIESAGHRVDICQDAESANTVLRSPNARSIHVVVLDVLLPGRTGIELCKELRSKGLRTPILLLTAVDGLEDKVTGLDAGADDYLTKPFPFPELLARLRALVRRPSEFDPEASATQIRVGDLLVDQLQHSVHRGAHEVVLTPQEYSLLEYLARHANRVLTREQLSAHLWPYGAEAGGNALESHISHLRAKLERDVNDVLIHTVRGVGYVIRTPRSESEA